jgi:hypothetical protein
LLKRLHKFGVERIVGESIAGVILSDYLPRADV